MILATLDGVAYQIALDPKSVDLEAVLGILFQLIHDALQQPAG